MGNLVLSVQLFATLSLSLTRTLAHSLLLASPSSGRKCATGCPSSKNVSPTGSPRTLGRSKGRLRLPQLCKNKLSSSKENLDMTRENGTDLDPKVTPDQGDGFSRGHALGGSQGELFAAQDSSEVTLANGYLCKQNSHSNGSINGEEEMVVDQRGEICVNPIYSLYAISVGDSLLGGRLHWFLKSLGFVEGQKASPPLCRVPKRQRWVRKGLG